MKTIYFSANENMLDEWREKFKIEEFDTAYDLESINSLISKNRDSIVIADLNSISHEINILISSGKLPENTIVLETSPEIPTGVHLINSGAKAYGNSRMLHNHFEQMYNTVSNGKTWTYPELTVSLASSVKKKSLSKESKEMIKKRLTNKEAGIVYLILKGLTNEAISQKTNISIRTVKAHTSSIFSKLHVNDRISLILLLK